MNAKKSSRKNSTWDERWGDVESGLRTCWETGKARRSDNPTLAKKAKRGELPMLEWKGGVITKLTTKKFGTLFYLAQLQGLKNEPLNINPKAEVELTCTKTKQKVTYTADSGKWN